MELIGIIIIEVVLTVACCWGILHENRLITFERRIARKLVRFIRRKRNALCAKWLAEEGLVVEPVFAAPKKKADVEALIQLINSET